MAASTERHDVDLCGTRIASADAYLRTTDRSGVAASRKGPGMDALRCRACRNAPGATCEVPATPAPSEGIPARAPGATAAGAAAEAPALLSLPDGDRATASNPAALGSRSLALSRSAATDWRLGDATHSRDLLGEWRSSAVPRPSLQGRGAGANEQRNSGEEHSTIARHSKGDRDAARMRSNTS